MDSSFDGVELREFRGGAARQGGTSSPWTTVHCPTRGFENASYLQDEEQEHHQQGATASSAGPNSASVSGKVRRVFFFGGSDCC